MADKSPGVKVGEEFKFELSPSSEVNIRLAAIEKKLSISRDPIRYPRTTLAPPKKDVEESPRMAQGTPPNPLQFIQGIFQGLPPLKLPPLPPLPVFPTTTSPTTEAEKIAPESETKPQAEVSEGIIPLVFE